MTYYKATRMDGTDFHTGKIDYTRVPLPEMSGEGEFPGAGWLHLATTPTECVGASWPCRLFEIEPATDAILYRNNSHPHKIGASKAFVTREIESWKFFGPQGKEVVAFIERAKKLDLADIKKLSAAYSAARSAARSAYMAARSADSAADSAAYSAARSAYMAARSAARSADSAAYSAAYSALALVTRDKISKEQYDILTIPWRTAIGSIHPDDAPVGRTSEIVRKIELTDTDVTIIQMAVKEGLDEITKLETRLYPRPTETSHLRQCFYAISQKFPTKNEEAK